MTLELEKNYSFFGKIENINQGDSWANLSLILENGDKQCVKIDPQTVDNYSLNKLYYFKTICRAREEKLYLYVDNAVIIYEKIKEHDELSLILKKFYEYAPVSKTEIEKEIKYFLNQIKNEKIKCLVEAIYNAHYEDFYLYPAATRFHHAYIGGLALHTLNMLKMAMNFRDIYSYLNYDLLIAGIILHDMGKIMELSGYLGAEYTVSGHLLGHLILEANEIEKFALKLDMSSSEEVLLLTHMVVSSHGLPAYGAAHKPMIPEALLLWYLDTIDSKFTVIGEEFLDTKDKDFTSPINVLDKSKMYKHSL